MALEIGHAPKEAMSDMAKAVFRFLIMLLTMLLAGAALWFGGRTVMLYFGPSERLLSKTGYQRDIDPVDLGQSVFLFAPQYPFWSDGAEKRRTLFLPPGSKIDNKNEDRWNFPVGARLWKDFERDGVLIETRMLLKYGSAPWEWDMAVYRWRDDYSDADKLILGKENARGTAHDIPSPSQCLSCHSSGKKRRPLGATAIQLPWTHESNLSLSGLAQHDLLTNPPQTPYAIPGDEQTQKALGYLDTNCGSCHYEGATYVERAIKLQMNLTTQTLKSVADTNVMQTAINRAPHFPGLDTSVHIEPGDPEASFIYKRMTTRGSVWQMPPLASEKIDEEGAELIGRWIAAMEPKTARAAAAPNQ